MSEYVKFNVLLSKETVEEIQKISNFRNSKSLIYNPDEKERSIEEFILGSTVYCLKNMQRQERLSGISELSRPFALRNKFKEFADKRGITQKDVFNSTGIALSNINNIWNNKTQPSLDYFFRLWFALGCPPFEKILFREEE